MNRAAVPLLALLLGNCSDRTKGSEEKPKPLRSRTTAFTRSFGDLEGATTPVRSRHALPALSSYQFEPWPLGVCRDSGRIPSSDLHDLVAADVNGNEITFAATGFGLGISEPGTTPPAFRSRSTRNGLPSNLIHGVAVANSRIFVATNRGLAVSEDGGESFATLVSAAQAPAGVVGVHASGDVVVAVTPEGILRSTNGGANWTSVGENPGVGSVTLTQGVVAGSGDHLAIATAGGLALSHDQGATWVTLTSANGLPSNVINSVRWSDRLYVSTSSGLAISKDNAASFTQHLVGQNILGAVEKGASDRLHALSANKLFIGTLVAGEPTFPWEAALEVEGTPFTGKSLHQTRLLTSISTTASLLGIGLYSAVAPMETSGLLSNDIRRLAIGLTPLSIATSRETVSWGCASTEVARNPTERNAGNAIYSNGPDFFLGTDNGYVRNPRLNGELGRSSGLAGAVVDVFAHRGVVLVATRDSLTFSTDNGLTFPEQNRRTASTGLPQGNLGRVFYAPPSTLLVTVDATLWKSEDWGTTWSSPATGLGGHRILDLSASNSTSALFLATQGGGVCTATLNSLHFTCRGTDAGLPSAEVQGLWREESDGVLHGLYAATNQGIALSTDGGVTFESLGWSPGISSLNARHVVRLFDGRLAIATDAGLVIGTSN